MSSKARLCANMLMKIIMIVFIAVSILASLLLITYKPVYSVTLKDEQLGYVNSKANMQNRVSNFLQYGDSENVGYVLLKESPEYQFELIRRSADTEEDEIFETVKSQCDIYYKVYAIEVDGEQACLAESLDEAQQIVDDVQEKQKNYTKQAKIEVAEKYEMVYDAIEDVELAVADIIEPIRDENNNIIRKNTAWSAGKSVSAERLTALKESTEELNFTKPVNGAIITSVYGWRRNGTEYHTGLDYAISIGTPIHAAEDGIVTWAQWTGNYGYLIKVQHAGGYETYYAHCSRFAVGVGTEVVQGDTISYVGSTGKSTGPHVHFEVRLNGKHMNPQDFL